MKSAVAAFTAAAARALAKPGPAEGSISLLITGDEEGPAINGTPKMLAWLAAHGEKIHHCIVGEPTAHQTAGDTIKIGRRGSINFELTVTGAQGHAAYPQRAKNPIPPLALLVARLTGRALDAGNAHFEPSTLVFTSLDVGNTATNVIPGRAHARFNIRFNDEHTPESLLAHVEGEARAIAQESGCAVAVGHTVSGAAFLTPPGKFTTLVAGAVESVTGRAPEFSTSGGTSDARFIKDHCPVVELGLAGTTMHQADEHVPLAEIARLTDIYAAIIAVYFTNPPL